jgi:hypothetical protein
LTDLVAPHLCPICIRPTGAGECDLHGHWQPHQLLTTGDRRRTSRERWHPYEPAAHACPRCLGDVTEGAAGYSCVEHGHDGDPHGPFRVDQLLGPSAQRESARARARVARRRDVRRVDHGKRPQWMGTPPVARFAHVAVAATVVAGTLAYLVR